MPLSEPQQLNWLYDLYQLGQSDAFSPNSNEVFKQILRHVLDGFNAKTGSLALCHNEDNSYLSIGADIDFPEEFVSNILPIDVKAINWVLEKKQALLVNNNNLLLDQSIGPDLQAPFAILCWPLLVGKRLIGALCINSFDGKDNYNEGDLARGQLLINLITIVIDNIGLHYDNKKRIQELAAAKERYINSNRQLQEAHKRLELSEQRLNDILNSLDSVVWSMEPVTLKMLYLNKAAHKVTGIPVESFFNDPHLWLNIVVSADRKRVENSLADLMKTGVQKITYRIQRPDGELRWLLRHMHIVIDDAGMPLRIDGITVDITQHKQAEDLLKQRNQELQKALDKIQEVQQQLMHSEKLSSIGQLAAGVAHEINNPLGYINSNLTSLKSYVEELLALVSIYEKIESVCTDAERLCQLQEFKNKIDLQFLKTDVLDLLDESHEGAFRVKKIVQDLKDFSHSGGDDDWQWVDLHTCLESTLNIANNEIRYKASVIKEFGNIPQVRCLPHQLNQVFMNLLVNAAHAIEKEGTIIVRTGAENDHIWVDISDTGKGISPEHVNKIFDPFFTTKPVGKGTGLGLSLSYNIIKKHNGEICLDSQIGKGTTFRIVLPIENKIVESA